jgi:hypothetical protein
MLIAQVVDIKSNLGTNVQFNLGTLVGRFAGVGLLLGAVATFAYIMYGGLKWIMAGGEKTKIEEAKSTVTQGVIGLMVVAASFALFRVVNYVLGTGIDILDR